MTACRRAPGTGVTVAALCAASAIANPTRAPAQSPLSLIRPDTAGQGALAAASASSRRAAVELGARGPAAQVLRDALARPHVLLVAPDTGLTLGRAARTARTLVVVGGPVRLAATVHGDVVVTGDLYLRPGANVDGRAVAVGGAVYKSTLARIGGARLSYRDLAVSARDDGAGGLAIALGAGPRRAPTRLSIPGVFGLRLPGYDRVNGLSVPFGPELALDTGRVLVEPLVTYRSQLGVIDPGVHASAQLVRGVNAELRVERGTFTNDAWSRGDFINSVIYAGTGQDARNYFRADRADLTLTRPAVGAHGVLEPLVGIRYERAFSVERTPATSRPFTLLGRDDARQGARRSNPAVTGGRVTSAFVGALVRRDTEAGTRGRAEARIEQALAVERGGRYTRGVVDLALERPLPSDRRLVLLGHAALVAGADVPTQRYAYLGGGPTLPSLDLLEQGGTRLLWAEGRYTVPLRVVRLPVVGTYPAFTLRGMAGAAGVGTLPPLTPNVGLRLNVGPLRTDYVFDPRGRGRRSFSVGVGLR